MDSVGPENRTIHLSCLSIVAYALKVMFFPFCGTMIAFTPVWKDITFEFGLPPFLIRRAEHIVKEGRHDRSDF
jgi:hypothetical protein